MVKIHEDFEHLDAALARVSELKRAAHQEWHAEEGCLDWPRIESYLDEAAMLVAEALLSPQEALTKAVPEESTVPILQRRIP
jgi:hypothetical protein